MCLNYVSSLKFTSTCYFYFVEKGLFLPKRNLPSARLVSNNMVGTSPRPSNRFTALLMTFGQYLDHDMDHVPVMEGASDQGIECCNEGFFKDDLTAEEALVCFPIRIPTNDPKFRNKKTSLNFVRSVGSIQLDCKPGPYQQVLLLLLINHKIHSYNTGNG